MLDIFQSKNHLNQDVKKNNKNNYVPACVHIWSAVGANIIHVSAMRCLLFNNLSARYVFCCRVLNAWQVVRFINFSCMSTRLAKLGSVLKTDQICKIQFFNAYTNNFISFIFFNTSLDKRTSFRIVFYEFSTMTITMSNLLLVVYCVVSRYLAPCRWAAIKLRPSRAYCIWANRDLYTVYTVSSKGAPRLEYF